MIISTLYNYKHSAPEPTSSLHSFYAASPEWNLFMGLSFCRREDMMLGILLDRSQQRPQPVQIICICPDICAFSVLHHRHLSDICAFCQKCQFEVKRADMYCCFSQRLRTCIVNKQTLPYWNLYWSKLQWDKYISSQNKLMWWLRAFVATWAMSHLRAYCRESRFVTNMRFFGFVLSRLLLRHLGFDSDFAQISE